MMRDAGFAPNFFAALTAAGMPVVPTEFSVVPHHQVVPAFVLQQIDRFIRVFDRVTTSEAWRRVVQPDAPSIARRHRPECCFFSCWDFHLPPQGDCQLIEFNDNGSGILFAAIINAVYHEMAKPAASQGVAAPPSLSLFRQHVAAFVDQEARAFFGIRSAGMLLILDDRESLQQGKFRHEFQMLRDMFHAAGWETGIGCPADLSWNGGQLLFDRRPVAFVVNRSTDFLWDSHEFAALRDAYAASAVYVAPNPFTYTTRSDKRLLEYLSLPDWDAALEIHPEERRILTAHVPESYVVRPDNVDMLASRKQDFVFKPLHGFAGRGLLGSGEVGQARLRRLTRQHEGYLAQRRVAKAALPVDGASVWTDLRIWAYRGEIFGLSGRASRREDRLDLTPPGGWLPTYAGT